MQELTQSAAPSETQPEQARPEIDQISDLLLHGLPAEKQQDAEQPLEGEAAEPEKAEEPAEPKEPEKAQIDYGMKIPIAGGEPVTLGELKDAFQAQAAKVLEVQERENRIQQANEEARLLLSYIQDLPPHVREAATVQAATDYKEQATLLVTAIPEMGTAAGAREVKARLYSLAAEYGVPQQTVDSIRDSTTIKMMHDFAQLKAAVKAARQNIKPLRSQTAKAQPGKVAAGSDLDVAIAKAKATKSQNDQIAAIDKLIRA